MNPSEKAALIQARCARAMIRAIGAQAENQQRLHCGYAVAYGDAEICAIIDDEQIDDESIRKVLES